MKNEDKSPSADGKTAAKRRRSTASRDRRRSALEDQWKREHEDRERLAELVTELQQRCSDLSLQLIKSDDARSVSLGLDGYSLCLSDGSEDVEIPLRLESPGEVSQFIADLSSSLWLLPDCAGLVQVDRGYIEVIIENINGSDRSWSSYSIDPRLFPAGEGNPRHGRITAVADHTDLAIEISQPSELFCVLESRIAPPYRHLAGTWDELTTLKISGIELRDRRHGQALLKEVAQSLSFYLETRFGRGFSLYPRFDWDSFGNRKYGSGRQSVTEPVRQPLKLTLNAYASDATSYYWHARKSESVPLAAYLGYYQVLEYHFQRYVRQDAIKLLRRRLKDPRVDTDSEYDLGRLIGAIESEIRRHNSELQQLASTLLNCLDPDELARFIQSNNSLSEHLARKDRIPGIPTVPSTLTGSDLVERVTDRIYKLRCQIVHSKGESKGGETFLLVPDSPAALSVKEDIKLVRFVAQSVIIASSGTLDLDRL